MSVPGENPGSTVAPFATPSRMAQCPWCQRTMTRSGLTTHKKLHCEQRPDLVKARAVPAEPAALPEVAPVFRPSAEDPLKHACGCGRAISVSRMRVHAVACSWARQDGYKPLAVRSNPCQCGCGGEVLSRGVKTGRYLKGHWARWYATQHPERTKHDKRPLAGRGDALDAAEEQMAPKRKREEATRREAEAAGAQIEANRERQHALTLELLGVAA